MDHFLTSLLQLVIVLDVLGLLAYFALGSLKSGKKTAPPPARPGVWARLRQNLRARREEDLDAALSNLKRVLYSYQQGLA
jgi:hypothetical protein